MTLDESMFRLRQQLEEAYGVDGAAILMDRPPGGWSAVVTNDTLDLKLAAVEERTRAQFAGVRSEIAELRGDLRGEIAELRGDLRGEIAGLRAELHAEMREQTWRLMGAMLASMAILGSILRFA
jgi:hypothetical protein